MLFSVLAIIYRVAHPGLAYAATVPSILLPHNFSNVIFQSTIAILLLVGFESVTAFGSEAINPKKDIRKAILLSLIIQGVFAYLFEYFAANYFVSTQLVATTANGATVTGYAAAGASGAPIGDMIRLIGDKMLGGTGLALVLVMAFTVVLALIGTTLACLNTGVRITYAMSKDKELPSIFGLLHGRFATPQWGIWVLVVVSAAFGAYGVLNVDNLTQITLASNTGTFLVYGITNLICLVAFWSRPGANLMKHKLVPLLGFLANLMMLVGIVTLSFKAGGSTSRDTILALGMVLVWMAVGIVWFIFNTRKQGHEILVKKPQLTKMTLMLQINPEVTDAIIIKKRRVKMEGSTRLKMEGTDTRSKQEELLLNDLYIDPVGYQVKMGQTEIDLTVKEFDLLYLFAHNRGKVVKTFRNSSGYLNCEYADEDGAINVMICRLRKKLEANPHRPRRLVSVRGLGYKLKEQIT